LRDGKILDSLNSPEGQCIEADDVIMIIIYKLGNKVFSAWDGLHVTLIIPQQTVMGEATCMRFAGSVRCGNLQREGCRFLENKIFTSSTCIIVRSKIHKIQVFDDDN
jgi:hypothetical protein